ncbi:Uncharacterised protein [Yersinia pseudotuberculosis]|nr:Uncharacterised protein [Yersinia pseudotuberculosis]
MTSLQTLLQLPRGWQVLQQITSPLGVSINLRATRKSANCPECLKCGRAVHSCRRRHIQYLPCSGQTLYLTQIYFIVDAQHPPQLKSSLLSRYNAKNNILIIGLPSLVAQLRFFHHLKYRHKRTLEDQCCANTPIRCHIYPVCIPWTSDSPLKIALAAINNIASFAHP